MDLLQPVLMAVIVNRGVMEGDMSRIGATGGLMLLVAFVGLLAGAGCSFYTNQASQGFGADLRLSVFHKIQSFSFRQLDRLQTGSLITRLSGDVMQLQNLVQMGLRVLVRSACMLVGSLIMVFLISPRLSVIVLLTVPLLAIILTAVLKRSNPLFTLMQRKLDRVNTVLQENTAGIRLVKAFVRADFEEKRFGRANGEYLDTGLKAAQTLAVNMPLLTLVLNVGIVAVLWYGGNLTWSGGMPIGDLAAFISYMMQILFALVSVGNLLMNIARARTSADRVKEVLLEGPDLEEPSEPARGRITEGRIVFDHVSFSYSEEAGEQVLAEISFTVEPGQTVGILGGTGAGKSSLVQLIPRLYDVTAGRVLIDGEDVRDYDTGYLRSRIGMVLQESLLFTGTIAENIRYGKPDATDEEVEEAARAAEAHEFISRLPKGYETELGQRGINLSGGQKQRISLARALVMKPPILILDDSTSAIDAGTEARIKKALSELSEETSCIIIAQRISSVIHADKIIVLDCGRVSAIGTHSELMAGSAVYRDIYRSQVRKEEALHG